MIWFKSRTADHRLLCISFPDMTTQQFAKGQKVKVVQQLPRQSGGLTASILGTVVRYEQSKTGSWFAHSKDGQLWLDRLVLQKADGELAVINLDQYTIIEPA